MASLTIDFQDGFAGDPVVARVDGREVYRARDVTTDYAIGRADSVTVEVDEGAVDIEVELPAKGLSKVLTLEMPATVYVGVSTLDDEIAYRLSEEAFLYF